LMLFRINVLEDKSLHHFENIGIYFCHLFALR